MNKESVPLTSPDVSPKRRSGSVTSHASDTPKNYNSEDVSPPRRRNRNSVNVDTNTTGSLTALGEPAKVQKKKPPKLVTLAGIIVESQFFTAMTTILTIYALTGEDLKIICWEKPADVYFDYITLSCLIVFSLEVILCCIGKDDYFMSFFFTLDIVSTVTLVLDLQMATSVVQTIVSGDQDAMDDLRSSRTARLGSKAGRVVRVLRLVRILKLYKAIYEARQAKKRRVERGLEPGAEDDDWDDINLDRKVDKLQRESRVGKKLSDLTIRRVILLVLAMMIFLPILSVDETSLFATAPAYGLDVVSDSYLEMEAIVDQRDADPSSVSQHDVDSAIQTYRKTMLRYIYYFNWYMGRNVNQVDTCSGGGELCSSWHYHHLFWVGFNGPDLNVLRKKADLAAIPYDIIKDFQESAARQNSLYTLGTMPEVVMRQIAGPWQMVAEDDGECSEGNEFEASDGRTRIGFSLLPELIPDVVDYVAACPEAIRKGSRVWYSSFLHGEPRKGTNLPRFDFYFDARVYWKDEAINQLYIIVFVCVSLCSAALFFSNDANRLVLNPVENMISKVEAIRDNPLMAIKMADDEFKAEEIERAQQKMKDQEDRWYIAKIMTADFCAGPAAKTEPMETVILEKTIVKLGSLLALGFGEAGSAIIEHNMHGVDTAGVDAMVAGTRVECIIGATRIRDFSIATEVLQAKVMTFVNQIAEIVHGVVDEFHGAANKNNGDTFLMIWRTSELETDEIQKLADMSMLAFSRILGAVHRSQVLAAYRSHPGFQQRLGKNCRVNLSSGLHYGWAIEGAVGSEFKIDASYLSPNVSIAETIERATEIYGVSVLVAESVIQICTSDMAAKCRLIDRVIITGSVEPMELHCIDLDYLCLAVEPPPAQYIHWTSRQRFKARQFLEAEKMEKWSDDVQMVNFFTENPDIAAMRFRYTLEFIHVFKMGYQNYAQGEWRVAKRLLSRTRTMLGVIDGPSNALLKFMEVRLDLDAPPDWNGVRELGMALLG